MNNQDTLLMTKYEITSKPKTSYLYKQYHYEHHIDAVNYTKSKTKRDGVL